MHRISLCGPWQLELVGDHLESRRKFHAPPRFLEERSLKSDSNDSQSGWSIGFFWHSALDWPISGLQLNELSIEIASVPGLNSNDSPDCQFDSLSGVGGIEIAGILRPFNEVVLVWRRWPSEWQPNFGRYSPSNSHPIHIDSWLEILD
ncbi:MAG: hypothetical protein SGI77_24740 [Pirellulaceae bacterium]|nr:hypothetical protein [Pirellulaceae bacterium]